MGVNNGHATKKHRDIGITNPYYTDTAIKKDLKDDIALLQSAFKKFNEEFWDGEIDKSTIIHIGSKMRKTVQLAQIENEKWIKKEGERKEECPVIRLSDKVLNMKMEYAYMYLVIGMIMLVDADKKQYSKDNHIKYKQLVARKGTYFSRKFAVECERIGISATPVISQNAADREKFSGRYTFAPEEKFIQFLEDSGLDKYKFTCGMEEGVDRKNKANNSGEVDRSGESKQSYRLLKCPKCGLKIRATKKGVKIKCCSAEHEGKEIEFEEVDKGKKNE